MNGTKSNGPKMDLFSFNEREKEIKRTLTLKYLILILLTNIFTYISFSTSQEDFQKKDILKPEHKRVILPIKNYSKLNLDGPTEVSLFSSENKLIIHSGFIIKKIETPEDIPHYLMEIKETDLLKLISYKKKSFLAYPKTMLIPKTKKSVLNKALNKRKRNYEIVL